MTEHIPSDDLFWTAARYAWGELSMEDATAFEDRLATDETACLAVAEAVQLMAHLKAATQQNTYASVPAADFPSRRQQRRSAAAWVTIAGLAVAMAWFAVQQASPPSSADPVSTELLARWTDAGSLTDADMFDDFDLEPELLDESLTAPGWLVQAVQLADDARTPTP